MEWCPVHGARYSLGCPRCEGLRRKQAFADWVAGLRRWDLTITLTFDPKRRAVVPPGPQFAGQRLRISPRVTEAGVRLSDVSLSGDVAQRRVKRWLRECQEALGRRICGIICLENHKSGEPHFHGLLGLDGGLQMGDVRTLSGLWFSRNGYNRLEVPLSVGDCAKYAAKYMSKDLREGGVMFWPEIGSLTAAEGQRKFSRNH